MKPNQLYYLREDAYFEPLVFKWYAWPYLIPPVSAAMNITGRGLRLMKSFVANHQLHLAAAKDPTLAGGDFVSCSEDQLEDVRALVARIETEHADYLDVRKAVADINQLLEPMKGMSLEPLYARLPEVLRGYVELVYDQSHSPSLRLIEGLLYEGKLYKTQEQSLAFGLLEKVKERPFVLSSPRLPDANHLHVQAPFADEIVDAIFATRDTPRRGEELQMLFSRYAQSGELSLRDLFTTEPPSVRHVALGGNLRVSYLGHAGLLIESGHT
ncbi:hypothetical protein, partial [Stenotrophomonas sp. P5_B8]